MLATIIQIALCVLFYGGYIALMVEFWWKSRHDKGRPNPAGDLAEEDDLPDA